MRTITRTIELNISPEEAAMAFIDMASDNQAIFFNICAEAVKEWDNGFEFQMQYVTNEKTLTEDARKIMSTIGDYAQRFLKKGD